MGGPHQGRSRRARGRPGGDHGERDGSEGIPHHGRRGLPRALSPRGCRSARSPPAHRPDDGRQPSAARARRAASAGRPGEARAARRCGPAHEGRPRDDGGDPADRGEDAFGRAGSPQGSKRTVGLHRAQPHDDARDRRRPPLRVPDPDLVAHPRRSCARPGHAARTRRSSCGRMGRASPSCSARRTWTWAAEPP